MALTETICYGLQVIRCKHRLLEELRNSDIAKNRGITEIHFKKIRLVLAAPKKYWETWDCADSAECRTDLKEIVKSVSKSLAGNPLSLYFEEWQDETRWV